MGYWRAKVVPMFKRAFERNGPTKAAAIEACKAFDVSKEEINKEFEEKKENFGPKVMEIYQASCAETKAVVKEPTELGIKKQVDGVSKFLEELSKIEFPGSKMVNEAASKYGHVLLANPIIFLLQKASTLLPKEVAQTTRDAEPQPVPESIIPTTKTTTEDKKEGTEVEKVEEKEEKKENVEVEKVEEKKVEEEKVEEKKIEKKIDEKEEVEEKKVGEKKVELAPPLPTAEATVMVAPATEATKTTVVEGKAPQS